MAKKKRLDLVLVNPGGRKKIYQSLGSTLSAIEPPVWAGLMATFVRNRGFSVQILDANAENLTPEETAERLAEIDPVLAAVVVYGHNPSASTQVMPAAGAICTAVKQKVPDAKVLLVGGHVAALPERTLREEDADFVCGGEGPYTILELLQAIKSGQPDYSKVRGLWYWDDETIRANPPAPLVRDLDREMPGIAWDLLPMDKYRAHNWHCFGGLQRQPYAALYTTLGCPFRCSFCCIQAPFKSGEKLLGYKESVNTYRLWSPQLVIDQIDKLVNEYGVRNIKIADEMFVLNRRHVMGICDLIIERGYDLNIWAYARVDTVRDDMLDKLKRAGFNWLAFGIECLDPEAFVLTSMGVKRLKNVEIGEGIMSYDTSSRGFKEAIVLNKGYKTKRTIKLRFPDGDIVCSPDHIFFYLDDDGEIREIKAGEIQTGALILGTHRDGIDIGEDCIDPQMAHLMGFAIGDGCIDDNRLRLTIDKSKVWLLEKYADIIRSGGSEPKVRYDSARNTVELSMSGGDNPILGIFRDAGLCGKRSHEKFVPDVINKSSNSVIANFIAGLFDADGSVYYKGGDHISVYLSLNNRELIEYVNYLLLYRFGIHSSRVMDREDDRFAPPKHQYHIKINRVSSIRKFYEKIDLLDLPKKEAIREYLSSRKSQRSTDYIKVPTCVIKEFTKQFHGQVRSIDREVGFIREAGASPYGNRRISIKKLWDFISFLQSKGIYERLECLKRYINLVESGVEFVKILEVEHLSDQMVCDITVADTHTFMANGLITHNSAVERVRDDVQKGFEQDELFKTLEKVRAAGINVGGNYIFGLPEDDFETMQATLDLALELNCEYANFYCFVPGTPVYTAYGILPIEKVLVGQDVLSVGGTTKVVDRPERYYEGNVYEVKLRYLPSVTVTPEHPILIAQLQRNRRNKAEVKGISWKRAKDIVTFDNKNPQLPYDAVIILKAIFKREETYVDFSPFVKGHVGGGRVGGQLNETGKRFLEPWKVTEDLAELFGWYVAEGSRVSKINNQVGFALCADEKENIERVRELVYNCFEYKTQVLRREGDCVMITLTSKVLYRALPALFGEDCHSKRVPEFIVNATAGVTKAFLKGYIAGDGTSHPNELGQFNVVSCEAFLARQVMMLFMKVGIMPSYGEVKVPEREIRGRTVKSTTAYCLSWIENPQYEHYLEDDENFYVPIKAVKEKEYRGMVYNLTTQDETYAMPFIVHNCAMAYPGSQLYDIAVKEGWPLPDNWSGYSQYSVDTLPLPTKYLSASEVLRFRDYAFQVYFNSSKYLDMITRKFGPETAQHIREMASHRLVRKYA